MLPETFNINWSLTLLIHVAPTIKMRYNFVIFHTTPNFWCPFQLHSRVDSATLSSVQRTCEEKKHIMIHDLTGMPQKTSWNVHGTLQQCNVILVYGSFPFHFSYSRLREFWQLIINFDCEQNRHSNALSKLNRLLTLNLCFFCVGSHSSVLSLPVHVLSF